MVAQIHLQGMGLLGSLTAWQLRKCGVEFTWNDTESQVNAWQASTGACYPASGDVDSSSHATWIDWSRRSIYPKGCVERCAYWVDSLHKSLPHGLEAEVDVEFNGLRLAGTSVHMNAQALVVQTRKFFEATRTAGPNHKQRIIVAHGFSKRRARFLWGWTRLIQLDTPFDIAAYGRPSFYLRKNRFQFAYCYPQPGGEWYYAGSNLISQHVAKKLDVEKKYAAWVERFNTITQKAIRIVAEGEILQGWRPAKAGSLSKQEGHKAASENLLLQEGRTIYFPVLASNGFRHFPEVWKQLADVLQIKNP